MGRPQQRTVTPRRSLNPATRPSYNDISWYPISVVGDIAIFQLSAVAASLVRKGIPQVQALSLAAMPISVVWTGSTMELQYPAALSNPESFTIKQGTPEVRSTSGGYLANGTFPFGSVTPPPAGTIFSTYCTTGPGFDLRGAVADGFGGSTDSLISANSPGCGYTRFFEPFAWQCNIASPTQIQIVPNGLSVPFICDPAFAWQYGTGGAPDYSIATTIFPSWVTFDFAVPIISGITCQPASPPNDWVNQWGNPISNLSQRL